MKRIGRNDNSTKIGDGAEIRNSFNKEINIFKIVINQKRFRSFYKFLFRKFCKKRIERKIFNQLSKKVETLKNNKKYIPNVFLENNEVKEKLRHMIEPNLFLKKIIEELSALDFKYFNSVYERLGFGVQKLCVKEKIKKDLKKAPAESIAKNVKDLKTILDDFVNKLPDLEDREALKKKLNDEQYWLAIKESYIKHRIEWVLNRFSEYLEIIKNKRICVITSTAGQGKTNILCDLAGNYLLKKKLPGIFFSGNEFNNLSRDKLESVIVNDVFGYDEIFFEEFIGDIEYVCKKDGKKFTIIIDAINENSNITYFSQELRTFLNKILEYDFIRVVITCRSEYFSERFSNLFSQLDSKKLLFFEDYNKLSWDFSFNRDGLPDHLENRLVNSYFNYFGVKDTVLPRVKSRLANDFLLLRIFSETYGADNAEKTQVYDIFRDDLFKAYYDYKVQEIKSKHCSQHIDCSGFFYSIISHMVNDKMFVNIDKDCLADIDQNILNIFVDEDVIFRKDLVKDELSVLGNKEVLNFTFDEFRDYLIADFLANSESFDILDFLENLQDNNPIKEGVLKYLFLKSRRSQYRESLSSIRCLTNYDEIFLENIFSVNDCYIDQNDIKKTKELFLISSNQAQKDIIFKLISRWKTSFYKALNIHTLFEIVYNLENEDYIKIIDRKFSIKTNGYYTNGEIVELIDEIRKLFDNESLDSDPDTHNLVELCFVLIGVNGDGNGGVYDELLDLLKVYKEKYPERTESYLEKYRTAKATLITRNLGYLN